MIYPIFLKLDGVPCLVFGGGAVATRKVRALLGHGARVTCVSREFSGSLRRLAETSPRLLLKRAVHPRLALDGARLVLAATSDRPFNARLARACRQKGIWVNVADDPGLCDFYFAALLERGPLQIAISTGGASPLFARRLREELERAIPSSTARLLEKIGKARRRARLLSATAPEGA